MSSRCESYYSSENVLVESFTCPKANGDSAARFCCGFSDLKYCCDDPNSFFPYEYGYMWWLRASFCSADQNVPPAADPQWIYLRCLGALVGLSVAAVVILAFIITLCVLCYLFISTKPRRLDSGLQLQGPGSTVSPQGPGPSHHSGHAGSQGLRKHFLRGKLDCDNQPPDPDRLFQRCFTATLTSVKVEGPT